jgi:hypothetical protein
MATAKDPREWDDIKGHVETVDRIEDIPALLNSLVEFESIDKVVEKEIYIDITDFIHEYKMLPISVTIRDRDKKEPLAEHRLFIISKFKAAKSASIAPYKFIATYTTENL